MAAFYELRAAFAKSETDRVWLRDKQTWATIPPLTEVPFLEEYATECGGDSTKGDLGVDRMREMVSATLDSMTLGTSLRANQSDETSVQVSEILGCVNNTRWLNDTTVHLGLKLMAAKFSGVVVFDPLLHGVSRLPDACLKEQRLLVFPLNYQNVHWCVIVVTLGWEYPTTHEAAFYEPFCNGGWDESLESTWASWIRPLLYTWNERDEASYVAARAAEGVVYERAKLDPIHRIPVLKPKQIDGSNCAVLCIAVALAYMSGDFSIQELRAITPSQFKIMRLRIIYMCLLKSAKSVDDDAKRFADDALAEFGSFGQVVSTGRRERKKPAEK
jgi:hypothetical protein